MYRVRTVFTGLVGTPWMSTFYFAEGAGTAQQAVAAAGAFWTSVSGSNMQTGLAWSTEAEVVLIDSATGDPTSLANTTPVAGTGTGGSDPVPAQCQILVRWRTGIFLPSSVPGKGPRELRGRTFIPSSLESNNLGVVSAAQQTFYNGVANTLLSAANADLVVFSDTKHSAATAVSASTWDKYASLRTRRD